MEGKNITGIRLRLLRDEREMSMEELCSAIERLYEVKINKGTYSKWERGENEPMLSYVRILSQYYDESMDFIAGLTNERRHGQPAAVSAS